MSKASKPPAMAPVVPHLTVDDTSAAIEFYKKAFGAVEIARHAAPDGKKIMHAAVLINGATVMLNDDFPEYSGKPRTPQALGGSPVVIHLNVSDVDASWQRAVKAGAEVTMALADQFWGDRYGSLRDPHGHEWSMSSAYAARGLKSSSTRCTAQAQACYPGCFAAARWKSPRSALSETPRSPACNSLSL